jgi:5'/3'-nucleotidase SurE
MRILLTNDDSISSGGIKALIRALSPAHEVWVVAPENEKSGGSHSITIHDSLRVREVGERLFSCRGTPADCVLISLLGFVPAKVDLVLSGINHGPNLGTDILFSGTAAGARQGALMGVPSVALSMAIATAPHDFTAAAEFALRNLEIFREMGTDDHFMNVNVPFGATRQTRPSSRSPPGASTGRSCPSTGPLTGTSTASSARRPPALSPRKVPTAAFSIRGASPSPPSMRTLVTGLPSRNVTEG